MKNIFHYNRLGTLPISHEIDYLDSEIFHYEYPNNEMTIVVKDNYYLYRSKMYTWEDLYDDTIRFRIGNISVNRNTNWKHIFRID